MHTGLTQLAHVNCSGVHGLSSASIEATCQVRRRPGSDALLEARRQHYELVTINDYLLLHFAIIASKFCSPALQLVKGSKFRFAMAK